MSKSLCAVVTTVSDGSFLQAFADAIEAHGSSDRIEVLVVGDINTPPVCRDAVSRFRALGFDMRYIDVSEQDKFLAAFPSLKEAIPCRSDNRRNVGYLMALRDAFEVVVSVDDDNLPRPDSPFFLGHALTGSQRTLPTLRGEHGWANICTLLDIRDRCGQRVHVYPRGFPHARRGTDRTRVVADAEEGVSGVHIGLWTDDPDVDAATRLSTACQAEIGSTPVTFVARGNRTPITSQNTSIVAAAVPAYYFWRMGANIGGVQLDRYGDMFSGYVVALCAEAVGHRVSVGAPFAQQRRNDRNLFKDLWHELPGMILMDALAPMLETPLTPTTGYDQACLEFTDRLIEWAHATHAFLWGESVGAFIEQIAPILCEWVDACRQLAPSGRLQVMAEL